MVERKLIALHSNLQTNCLISISEDATISDLRGLIQREHVVCFPEHGSVRVGALTVEYDQQQYRLTESLLVGQVLTKKWNKLHVELSSELLKQCSTSNNPKLSTEKNVNIPKFADVPHNQVVENVHEERQASSEEGAVAPANDPDVQESPSLSATDNLGSHFLSNEGLHTQPRSDDTTHPLVTDFKKEYKDSIRGSKKQHCLETTSNVMNLVCAKTTAENAATTDDIGKDKIKILPSLEQEIRISNFEGDNTNKKYCLLHENVELAAVNGLLSMSAGQRYIKHRDGDKVQGTQSDQGNFEIGKDSERNSPNAAIVKQCPTNTALKDVEENTTGTSTKEATKISKTSKNSEEVRKYIFHDEIEDHTDGNKSRKYPIRLNDHSILLVTSLSTDEVMETHESEMNTQDADDILGDNGKLEPTNSEKKCHKTNGLEQNALEHISEFNNSEMLKTLGDTENDSQMKNHETGNQSPMSTRECHEIYNDQVDQVKIAITTDVNTVSAPKKHKKKKNEKRVKRSAQEKLLLTMQQDAGKKKNIEEQHAESSFLSSEGANKTSQDGANKNYKELKPEKKKRKRDESSRHAELINDAEERETAVEGALLGVPENAVTKENEETEPERANKKQKRNKKERKKKHVNEIVNVIFENAEETNVNQNQAWVLIENDTLPETSKGNTDNLDDAVHGRRSKSKKKSKTKTNRADSSQHAEPTDVAITTKESKGEGHNIQEEDTLQQEEPHGTNKKHENVDISYLSPEEGSNKENIMENIDHLINTQVNDTESPLDGNMLTTDRGMDVFEFQGSEIGSRQDDSCSPGGQSCEKAQDRNVDDEVLGSVNNLNRRSTRKTVHPRSWVSVLSQRLRNPRFSKEDLETTTKAHAEAGEEIVEEVQGTSQINPDEGKVTCPVGCGRTYSKKTSAYYRHRRRCKG